MPVTDPVADMLTRIRNAIQVRHEQVMMPHSKTKLAIAKILKEEGYIRDFDIPRGQAHPTLRVHLAYRERREPAIRGLKRVSKPGVASLCRKGRNTQGVWWPRCGNPFHFRGCNGRPPSVATRYRRGVALLCLVVRWSMVSHKGERCLA